MAWRVSLHSLGCRLNQSEVEAMGRRFITAGHILVDGPAHADICVVNTCAVTAEAERKTRRLLRMLHRANPAARIAAVGCAATLDPQALACLPGVVWVVPNAEKERTVEIVAAEASPLLPSGGDARAHRRTRAFVKVQDGCDNRCTYCIVRLLRGAARSRSLEEVVAEVQALVRLGYREAVLTGVNLGAYGRDVGMRRGLERLVQAILSRTDLSRLRLSSLEPWDLDERLFALWDDSRLCRQLHLPLQAGCDEILRRMGRPITTGQYAGLVRAARDGIPDLAVTTDVMVGFPGEGEAAFAASVAFVERIGFARLHVFPFSPRPGTPAVRLPGQVPLQVRRERADQMRKLGARLEASFYRRFVGRVMGVLWGRVRPDSTYRGLTDNYLRVMTAFPGDLRGCVVPTRLLAARGGLLMGVVVEGESPSCLP